MTLPTRPRHPLQEYPRLWGGWLSNHPHAYPRPWGLRGRMTVHSSAQIGVSRLHARLLAQVRHPLQKHPRVFPLQQYPVGGTTVQLSAHIGVSRLRAQVRHPLQDAGVPERLGQRLAELADPDEQVGRVCARQCDAGGRALAGGPTCVAEAHGQTGMAATEGRWQADGRRDGRGSVSGGSGRTGGSACGRVHICDRRSQIDGGSQKISACVRVCARSDPDERAGASSLRVYECDGVHGQTDTNPE